MIRRQRVVLAIGAAVLLCTPAAANAQKKKKDKEAAPAAAPAPAPTPPPDDTGGPTIEIENPEGDQGNTEETGEQPIPEPEIEVEAAPPPTTKGAKKEAGAGQVSWRDVVVVKRKPFLKNGRLELVPTLGITLNDNMIRHFQFAGQLNYWLTDALAVGFEGEFFRRDLLEPYELIATQYRRLPTLNQYNFGAALNFHYVPIYAKFAVLNNQIIHWEVLATAGVGFQQSEVLPRDPALPGWTNFLITPNVGLTMRVFLTQFLTFQIGVRDYVFNDKFESVDRNSSQSLQEAMDNAQSLLVNHIVFQAGISFWFPTSFRYTTFR